MTSWDFATWHGVKQLQLNEDHQKERQRSYQLDFAGDLDPGWLHHYKFNYGVYQGL